METTTTTNDPAQTKRCLRCGLVKPVSDFSKRAKSKDGLQLYCKQRFKTGLRHSRKKDENPGLAYSQMEHREIIAEIRKHINYLRDHGWSFTGELQYTKTYTVKL